PQNAAAGPTWAASWSAIASMATEALRWRAVVVRDLAIIASPSLRPDQLPARGHPLPDLPLRPAGQRGEVLRLVLEAVLQCLAIFGGARAGRAAAPGMAQHVARLEVLAVVRLHQRQVLGEMRPVVAHVQAGHVGVGAGAELARPVRHVGVAA